MDFFVAPSALDAVLKRFKQWSFAVFADNKPVNGYSRVGTSQILGPVAYG